MHVAGKTSDKWAHEPVPNGYLPIQPARGQVDHHIVRVISENLRFVSALPGFEVLVHKGADDFGGGLGGWSRVGWGVHTLPGLLASSSTPGFKCSMGKFRP